MKKLTEDEIWELLQKLKDTELETKTVEFKRNFNMTGKLGELKKDKSRSFKITRAICAFLNTGSGRVFIGVDDDANLIGLEEEYLKSTKKKHK